MLRKLTKRMSRWFPRRGGTVRRQATPGFRPLVEALAERIAPAVTAFFTPSTGQLTILGDGLDNNITVSRDAAGRYFNS